MKAKITRNWISDEFTLQLSDLANGQNVQLQLDGDELRNLSLLLQAADGLVDGSLAYSPCKEEAK